MLWFLDKVLQVVDLGTLIGATLALFAVAGVVAKHTLVGG